MDNILIIKTSAAGDVVRTTSLLNVLQGNIYWVIADKNKLLLPDDRGIVAVSVAEAAQLLPQISFDLIISLEEDVQCVKLASMLNSRQLTGLYWDDGRINYTNDANSWFDMSRVSRLGMKEANRLKFANDKSYQHHIFNMLGKKFNGERYLLYRNSSISSQPDLIGIETRTGTAWPDKQWSGYDELITRLTNDGKSVKTFEYRKDIRDYLSDIARCSYLVSGDTLAMHIALAHGITCAAIFNCTSPAEIYDYGLLKKVVSPLLEKYFYVSSDDDEVIRSIDVEQVYDTLIDHLKQ